MASSIQKGSSLFFFFPIQSMHASSRWWNPRSQKRGQVWAAIPASELLRSQVLPISPSFLAVIGSFTVLPLPLISGRILSKSQMGSWGSEICVFLAPFYVTADFGIRFGAGPVKINKGHNWAVSPSDVFYHFGTSGTSVAVATGITHPLGDFFSSLHQFSKVYGGWMLSFLPILKSCLRVPLLVDTSHLLSINLLFTAYA